MRAWGIALFLAMAGGAWAAAIDDVIAAEMKEQRIPGMAMAIVRGGQPVYVRGYGVTDLEGLQPVTKDTVFPIASLTKPFVAACLLRLWEQGRLNLDAQMGSYLSGLPAVWAAIPVRAYLNHTSGVPEMRL